MWDENYGYDEIKRAKAGDNEAKEFLLKENLRLIKSIVKRYMNKGVEYDDLFSLASIGFLKAISGFDESFGVRFSTYAVPMIAGEIKRFMRDDGSMKVSRIIKRNAREINAYISEYFFLNGVSPTTKEIAEKFGMDESEVMFTLGSAKMPLSLYEKGEYKDEESGEIIDKIPSADSQEDMIENIQLKTAISSLNEREKRIILLRYFRDMTQSEVALLVGVSQVQVSRIENRVIKLFKEKLA